MSETQPEQYECSICLESIENNINKVITECGHIFHCSCIMTNIIHNGFNCPNCRARMAEEISDDNSDNDNSSNWSTEDEDEDREIYEDDILRGFRMFNNLINGEEHEYEDIGDEYVYQNYVLNAYTNEDINADINADINTDINEEPVINVDISENTDIILEDGNLEDGNLEDDLNPVTNAGLNLQLSEEQIERLYERNGEDYYNRINSRNDGYVFYEGGGFHHPDYLDEYSDSDSDSNSDIEFYNELYSQIFIRRDAVIGVASDVASNAALSAVLENGTQSLSAVLNVADDEDVRNYFRDRHIITN